MSSETKVDDNQSPIGGDQEQQQPTDNINNTITNDHNNTDTINTNQLVDNSDNTNPLDNNHNQSLE